MEWLTDQSTNAKIVSSVNCESTSVVDEEITELTEAHHAGEEFVRPHPFWGSFSCVRIWEKLLLV